MIPENGLGGRRGNKRGASEFCLAGEWDAWPQLDAGGLELVEGQAPADRVLFGAGEPGLQRVAALLGLG